MRTSSGILAVILAAIALPSALAFGQVTEPGGTLPEINDSHPPASQSFDALADAALLAMRHKAAELKTSGVALVAFFPGEKIESWNSKMVVVGQVKHEPTAAKPGDNLLAIAYAKAAEMADTLKDSGSKVRPPMTGEFGWEGGVIAHVKGGYVIAAFSGGQSADDVAISRAGAAEIVNHAPAMKAVP